MQLGSIELALGERIPFIALPLAVSVYLVFYYLLLFSNLL